jgi:uncharacterized protein
MPSPALISYRSQAEIAAVSKYESNYMDQINNPLSDDELDWLDDFLLYRIDEEEADAAVGEVDEGILNIAELDGYLTAIVSGPNTVMPSKWKSESEFEKVFNLLVRHMNSITGMLINSPDEFEPVFMEREADGRKYLIVDEWCEGYLRGVALDETGLHASEIAQQLDVIALFGAEAGWEALEKMNLQEVEQQQALIPAAVREIHAYWYARRGEAQTIRRSSPKMGRNDLCPCGSGKKFKKCCGAGPTLH